MEATREALLAAVYADPDADGPRLVYADWCLARGDPHGELIAFQLAERDRPLRLEAVQRERELVEAHRQRWLAPIWDALHAPSLRFERGFLAHARITRGFRDRAERPEWSTVTSIELSEDPGELVERLVGDRAVVPALRELRGVPRSALGWLAARGDRLAHLGTDAEPADLRRALDGDPLPALRSLGITGSPEGWSWLWSSPVGARLERLELTGPFVGASPWLVPGRRYPPTLRRLDLRAYGHELRLTRDGDAFPRAELVLRNPYPLGALASLLQLVPGSLLRDVTLWLPVRLDARAARIAEGIVRRAQRRVERYLVQLAPSALQ